MAPTLELETRIAFDRFGWDALEQRAAVERLDAARLVAQACAYYASELDRGRAATRAPRFKAPPQEQDLRPLKIQLDPGVLARLEHEAERQAQALERLIEHAVLLYLADVDAGQVAERVARGADA